MIYVAFKDSYKTKNIPENGFKIKLYFKQICQNERHKLRTQQEAINTAIFALNKFDVEQEIADYIKNQFDLKYNPTWHCIVGRNFGEFQQHSKNNFIYFYHGQVMLYKDK